MKEKQTRASELATSINASKKQIDEARLVVEQKKRERIEEDEIVDEEGEPVISEEEFSALSKLKEVIAVTERRARASRNYGTPRHNFIVLSRAFV